MRVKTSRSRVLPKPPGPARALFSTVSDMRATPLRWPTCETCALTSLDGSCKARGKQVGRLVALRPPRDRSNYRTAGVRLRCTRKKADLRDLMRAESAWRLSHSVATPAQIFGAGALMSTRLKPNLHSPYPELGTAPIPVYP